MIGNLSFGAQMAGLACDFDGAEIPASARHVLRLSLLDWAAVAIAGRDEPVSKILRNMVVHEGGRAEATLVGTVQRVPARAAGLSNGTTSHALDYDDTHFLHIGHPSVAVLPAALALAERQQVSGRGFFEAALLGYEASCRIGHWLGRSHYEAGFHQTATAGAFGATLAGARLLGLDRAQTVAALGLAATRVSGLKCQFGTMGKPYNAGIAAANGVEAALLAGVGMVSPSGGLDGPLGFGQTHAGAATEIAADGLGEVFVLEGVSHKFHACCHGTHAMLEALSGLRQLYALAPEAISRVEVTVHPRWLNVCNIAEPATGLEAKFSYRLTAAMALMGLDTGALESFADAFCADSDLVALRNRVEVKSDIRISDTAAQVFVLLQDDTAFHASHDLKAVMAPQMREDKVRNKAVSLVGKAWESRLWSAISDLEAAPDVTTFTAALQS